MFASALQNDIAAEERENRIWPRLWRRTTISDREMQFRTYMCLPRSLYSIDRVGAAFLESTISGEIWPLQMGRILFQQLGPHIKHIPIVITPMLISILCEECPRKWEYLFNKTEIFIRVLNILHCCSLVFLNLLIFSSKMDDQGPPPDPVLEVPPPKDIKILETAEDIQVLLGVFIRGQEGMGSIHLQPTG